MIEPRHRRALVALLGEGGALFDPAAIASYGAPARYQCGAPGAVLRPRTTAEVSAAVGYCVRNRLAFVPQSANTGLVLGSTPDGSGKQIVLSLERLTSLLDVDPLDRTARTSAGVRLSALNAALEPHGLFLPVDLAADPMIGGMAATNTGGARYLRYGDMRRHVLGLEVVLADEQGTVVRLSKGLRKDNSTLPLRQLFVGSCGALGVITEVELEVHRRPTQSAATLVVPRRGRVLELLALLESAAGGSLAAVEGMSRAAMARAFASVPSLRNPFPRGEIPSYAILVEVARAGGEGLDGELDAMLSEIAVRPKTPLVDAFVGPVEPLWAIRHSLSEGLRAAGPVVGFDLAFRRSVVFEFRTAAIGWLGANYPEYEVCDYGHIADGGLHFNLVRRDRGAEDAERLATLRQGVLNLAVGKFGGTFSGEHGLGRATQEAYDQFTPDDVKTLSAAVSALFGRAPTASFRLGPA